MPSATAKPLKVRPRVLVVAYEADTCLLLSGLFVREGFYVGLVDSIAEMGKVVEQEEPPAVLIVDDRAQPTGSVHGLVRLIRMHEHWNKTALVVLTHDDSENREVEFFKMGVDDYIVKPLRTKALIARIARRISHV